MTSLFCRATLLCLAATLFSCHWRTPHPPADCRSFYYWKSVYSLNAKERDYLNALNVKHLYIRFFDVTWDAQAARPVPTAPIRFKDSSYLRYTITPVVFITNEVLARLDSAGIVTLATNLGIGVGELCRSSRLPAALVLQLDCDWSATTRDRYFSLLTHLRHWLDAHGQHSCQLSATIRLYQCKYWEKTGVPPVAKGLLMCYNMGDRKNPRAKNSILETVELEKYTAHLSSYPLPLDIALPIFDWKVLFHGAQYAGLVDSLPAAALTGPAVGHSGDRYIFRRDTTIDGYPFQAGDQLRDERSDYETLIATARIVARKLKGPPGAVILFHLDSSNLINYTPHELQDLFDRCY